MFQLEHLYTLIYIYIQLFTLMYTYLHLYTFSISIGEYIYRRLNGRRTYLGAKMKNNVYRHEDEERRISALLHTTVDIKEVENVDKKGFYKIY